MLLTTFFNVHVIILNIIILILYNFISSFFIIFSSFCVKKMSVYKNYKKIINKKFCDNIYIYTLFFDLNSIKKI